MKVQDKIWVVTGAGSGIGRELALQLLAKGGQVAIVDLNPKTIGETLRLATKYSGQVSSHLVNITDRKAVLNLPDEVIRFHGRIDGLINNAGIIQPFVRVNDLDFDQIQRVMDVNFYGTLNMIKAFLPEMLGKHEAHIVNVSSMGGFSPVPGQTVYGASKAAVKLLTEGLYTELKNTNIHVSTVFPGSVATNITANSGVSVPADMANKESDFKPLEASKAASIIIDGIEKNKYRILVGKDARFLDFLSRLAPEKAASYIAKKMKDLLPDQ